MTVALIQLTFNDHFKVHLLCMLYMALFFSGLQDSIPAVIKQRQRASWTCHVSPAGQKRAIHIHNRTLVEGFWRQELSFKAGY